MDLFELAAEIGIEKAASVVSAESVEPIIKKKGVGLVNRLIRLMKGKGKSGVEYVEKATFRGKPLSHWDLPPNMRPKARDWKTLQVPPMLRGKYPKRYK